LTLARVLWIGGGTSAGKTSLAKAVASRYGLASYHVDDHELEHARRRDPHRHPAMEAWNAGTLDEIWVELPIGDLVEATLAYSRERIEFISGDIRALAADGVAVAEGFQLTPEAVASLLDSPREAVWLLPTPAFARKTLLSSPRAWDTPRRTSDPERAQAHRIERDRLIVERVREQAAARGLRVIDVDGTKTIDEVLAMVEEHFEPFL
jgi:adenylate kinase family enzyme